MEKKLRSIKFFSFFLFLILFFGLIKPGSVYAGAHLSLSPSSGIISSSGTAIDVQIDTDGEAVKSAKAVINFDANLLEVTAIQASDFFDDVSYNIYNANGQIVINANIGLDSMLETRTGTGIIATMTVNAKAVSGSAQMVFDCTDGSSTDSNINDPTPLDIIVCSENINGNYTLGGTIATPTPYPTDGTTNGTTTNGTTTGTTGIGYAPMPVTGVSWPTLVLFGFGLLMIGAPLALKVFLK